MGNSNKKALRPFVMENVEEKSIYWPRVNNSLKYLAKRLKNDEAVELVKALEEKTGECVLIARSEKQGTYDDDAHVLSARIFRFAWLDGPPQLQSAQVCPNGFSADGTGDFCINPYHYEIDRSRVITMAVEKDQHTWPAGGLDENLNAHLGTSVPSNYELDPDSSLVTKSVDGEKLAIYTEVDKDKRINPEAGTQYDPARLVDVELRETLPWMKLTYFEETEMPAGSFSANSDQFEMEADMKKTTTPDRLVVSLVPEKETKNLWKNGVRAKIGSGFKMHYVDGCIYIENRSKFLIFVQCPFVNLTLNRESTAVIRVPSKCVLKLWDNVEFATILSRASFRSFEAVNALKKWVNIRISLGLAWGNNYKMTNITDLYLCYVAIYLPQINAFIDNTLDAMGRP